MFVDSEGLRNRIQSVAEEINLRSGGKIAFAEYISLPYYGYVILRFSLTDSQYTVDDLDCYEAMMYECAKDEFLIDFMGDVYRAAGVDYRRMDRLLADCLDLYGNESLFKSVYADRLEEDAGYLLALCGLSRNLPVWEIQLEEEVQLLILGAVNRQIGRFCGDGLTINVHEVEEKACRGRTRAAFYARRKGISLVRALLKAQEAG